MLWERQMLSSQPASDLRLCCTEQQNSRAEGSFQSLHRNLLIDIYSTAERTSHLISTNCFFAVYRAGLWIGLIQTKMQNDALCSFVSSFLSFLFRSEGEKQTKCLCSCLVENERVEKVCMTECYQGANICTDRIQELIAPICIPKFMKIKFMGVIVQADQQNLTRHSRGIWCLLSLLQQKGQKHTVVGFFPNLASHERLYQLSHPSNPCHLWLSPCLRLGREDIHHICSQNRTSKQQALKYFV